MSQAKIEQAINSKHIIEFSYNGYVRIVEPHVLGLSKGVLQILGYQIGGASSSGGIPEWRRFDVNGMVGLSVTDKSFPGQRPVPGKHSVWDQIYLIVSK